jgi:hypothetical protein
MIRTRLAAVVLASALAGCQTVEQTGRSQFMFASPNRRSRNSARTPISKPLKNTLSPPDKIGKRNSSGSARRSRLQPTNRSTDGSSTSCKARR